MIELKNVYFKYKNSKENTNILNNINLKINNGEFISIIGNNGEGKSTLVKLLSGIILPTKGDILINDINTKSNKDFLNLRKNISVVFQNPDNQIIFERIYEELEFTLKNFKIPKNEIEERIDSALKSLNMLEFKYALTSELSLGQKQKIIIAEALSLDTDILVLDEPTAMLDPISKKEFLNILNKLHKNGKTIIMVTHILDEIFYSSRCIYLNQQILEEDFKTDTLFYNLELLKKINKQDSVFSLTLLTSLLENNIKLDLKNYHETSYNFYEYLNNEIINKIVEQNNKQDNK